MGVWRGFAEQTFTDGHKWREARVSMGTGKLGFNGKICVAKYSSPKNVHMRGC